MSNKRKKRGADTHILSVILPRHLYDEVVSIAEFEYDSYSHIALKFIKEGVEGYFDQKSNPTPNKKDDMLKDFLDLGFRKWCENYVNDVPFDYADFVEAEAPLPLRAKENLPSKLEMYVQKTLKSNKEENLQAALAAVNEYYDRFVKHHKERKWTSDPLPLFLKQLHKVIPVILLNEGVLLSPEEAREHLQKKTQTKLDSKTQDER